MSSRAVSSLLAALALPACQATAQANPTNATNATGSTETKPAGLSVSGHRLLRDGAPFRVHGVNHAGMEFACVNGTGLVDGPEGDALLLPMKAWNVNAVRVPLNEACWLGAEGVAPERGGEAYRSAVLRLLRGIHAQGMIAILDLHWSAPGTQAARGQSAMANADRSLPFWSSVATTLRDDREVMFDLYNEPHDVDWACWRDGCDDPGFRVAGMQALVDAVRATGARQPLLLGGLGWSNDLSGWSSHAPRDPERALIAAFHAYNFTACNARPCWDSLIGTLASEVPVLLAEVGEDDCGRGFLDQILPWADAHSIGYLGWTWNTWDCHKGPSLISDYQGTPTAFGLGLRDHLRAAR